MQGELKGMCATTGLVQPHPTAHLNLEQVPSPPAQRHHPPCCHTPQVHGQAPQRAQAGLRQGEQTKCREAAPMKPGGGRPTSRSRSMSRDPRPEPLPPPRECSTRKSGAPSAASHSRRMPGQA